MTATPRDILETARAIAEDIAYQAARAGEKKDRPEYERWMARSIARALLDERNRKSSPNKGDGK